MMAMLPKGRVERSTLLAIDSEWRMSIRRACSAPQAGCARPVASARPRQREHQQREEHRRRTAKNLSRTIRLSLLAPDIVEAILNGTQPATLQLADLEGPFSVDWEQQRATFGFAAKPSR